MAKGLRPWTSRCRIHLDYGLKGTDNYAKDANNNAIDATTLAIRIPDEQSYTLSDTAGGATIQSENSFKRDPGIDGLVLNANGDPQANVKVQIYNSSGTLLATVYTDADGSYMWQYKHTGRPATFTVKLPAYSLLRSVTLKANGFVEVDFTVE